MKNQKTTFYANHIAIFSAIFMLFIGYPLSFLLIFVIPDSSIDGSQNVAKLLMAIIFFTVPSLYAIFSVNLAFSKVTIDENGIHKALFKRYFKKTILWTEAKEIKLYNRVDTWVFISKVPMEGLTYNQLLRHKGIIQVTATKQIKDLIIKHALIDIEK